MRSSNDKFASPDPAPGCDQYTPPRPLDEIEADIADIEKDIVGMLRGVVG